VGHVAEDVDAAPDFDFKKIVGGEEGRRVLAIFV
jgi:hypothetical protein